MKSKTTLFLSLLTTLSLTAQTLPPIGANWNMQYSSIMGGGATVLSVTKDTMINGRTCRKIDEVSDGVLKPYPFSYYLYISGDSLFSSNTVAPNVSNFLYRFNMQVGDTTNGTFSAGNRGSYYYTHYQLSITHYPLT